MLKSCMRIFYFAALILNAVIAALDYSALQTYGVSCDDSRDSCSKTRDMNFTTRSCECDKACGFYQDCCIDSTFKTNPRSQQIRQKYSCLSFGENKYVGAYAIDWCPPGYNDLQVKQKCHTRSNIREPLLYAPMTDVTNQVTYKNRYCAACHGIAATQLKSWLIRTECLTPTDMNINMNQFWQNIRFDVASKKWGVDVDSDFYTCDLWYDIPSYLSRKVRQCRTNAISKCLSNWTRSAAVKASCPLYEAVVYHDDVAYKNVHCAVCNNIAVTNLSCNLPVGIVSRRRNAFHFGRLLDVNQGSGNEVGVVNRCAPNQTFDPYQKMCHNLSCVIPGYVLRNGQCAKM